MMGEGSVMLEGTPIPVLPALVALGWSGLPALGSDGQVGAWNERWLCVSCGEQRLLTVRSCRERTPQRSLGGGNHRLCGELGNQKASHWPRLWALL